MGDLSELLGPALLYPSAEKRIVYSVFVVGFGDISAKHHSFQAAVCRAGGSNFVFSVKCFRKGCQI